MIIYLFSRSLRTSGPYERLNAIQVRNGLSESLEIPPALRPRRTLVEDYAYRDRL